MQMCYYTCLLTLMSGLTTSGLTAVRAFERVSADAALALRPHHRRPLHDSDAALLLARTAMSAIDWILRVGAGIVFLGLGYVKLTADASSMWVGLFAAIGLGQWFRYFTGAMQATAGLLMLVPRTAWIGAAMAACTMIGAIIIDLFVLNVPDQAVIPALLLALVAIVFARSYREKADLKVGLYEH